MTARNDKDGDERSASFGYRNVAGAEKTALVRGVFSSVAARYDLMNDLMSGGLHRLWKAAMIARLNPRPGQNFLDIAGGTGDIAMRIVKRLRRRYGADHGSTIHVCDLTDDMLAVGRKRAGANGLSGEIRWVCGAGEALPFADSLFDGCTIAFGLRNMTDLDAALAQAYRVLRPGGLFLCLEFSRVSLPVLADLYDTYSFRIIPSLGGLVTGDSDSYRYLVESIRRFPAQPELAERMREAGFGQVHWRNLSAGIVAIHSGWRL